MNMHYYSSKVVYVLQLVRVGVLNHGRLLFLAGSLMLSVAIPAEHTVTECGRQKTEPL